MSIHPVVHNTFTLTRNYPVSVDKLFQAFADPQIKQRWHGDAPSHSLEEFTMDFRAGGSERFVYRLNESSPFPDARLVNVSHFHDIVPSKRILQAQTMAMNENTFSSALLTFEFSPSAEGSTLILTHQGAFLESSDGPEMRKGGWETLFTRLGRQLTATA